MLARSKYDCAHMQLGEHELLTNIVVNGRVQSKIKEKGKRPEESPESIIMWQSQTLQKLNWKKDNHDCNERNFSDQQAKHHGSAAQHTCCFMPIIHISD